MTGLQREYRKARAALDGARQAVRDGARDDRAHLDGLLAAEKSHSPFTRLHTEKVAFYAQQLALALGWGGEAADRLRDAARLHDVGKMRVPEEILNATDGYTPQMREAMKLHTTHGALMLARHPGPVANLAAELALWHHERMDGEGYFRLPADEIPQSVRICTVADVFEALTARRPYKDGMTPRDALALMTRPTDADGSVYRMCRGIFDPRVLSVLTLIAPRIHAQAQSRFGALPEDNPALTGAPVPPRRPPARAALPKPGR